MARHGTEGRWEANEYGESIDALKANLAQEQLAEVEAAIQLAAFRMDHGAAPNS